MKSFSSPRGSRSESSAPRLDPGGLYRVIFEQARDSILVLELPPEGVPVIRDANPAALILHGYAREDLVGKPVTVLGASLNRGRLARHVGSSAFEVLQKRSDGAPLITEVTARNIEFGSVTYGILIERDVTPRRRQEDEGRRLSGRIMLAREAEKKRLAASLHDAIGAIQVGMASELLLIEEELRGGDKRRAFARIGHARKLLKKVTSAVKGACVESWPPALAVSGLDAVLRELLSGFSRRSKIAVRADISLPEAEHASESPLAIVLYRLAQEALSNAEKHSGAKKLDFSVTCANCWMTLSVRDDGRGFDMAKARNKKTSLGLKIMAEAADSAGGYFSVYSKPAGGTLIKAELPLRPEPAL
ncbi:MAG: hypothetical protein A2016_10540 [Elusimicrobia bacterium GWF2_62_30]|nr:MAG: hypothetical protein A2016_10540 [Elusimicrobia bacterium GWF2_62_30]